MELMFNPFVVLFSLIALFVELVRLAVVAVLNLARFL